MNEARRGRRWWLAAGAILVALGAVAECPDWLEALIVGETVEVTTDEPGWLGTNANWQHVYRLDASGPDGSALEVWTVSYDSFSYCDFVEPLVEAEVVGGAAEMVWTSSYGEVVGVEPVEGGGDQTFQLTLTELAAPPRLHTQVIQAAARTPGVGDSFFRTDLELFNVAGSAVTATLALVDGEGHRDEVEVSLEAHAGVIYEDVVGTLFARDQAVGALVIASRFVPSVLLANSRTYTSDERGTFGQFIPSIPWQDSAVNMHFHAFSTTRLIPLVSGGDEARTNVGFVEVMGLDAEVRLTLTDDFGRILGEDTITVVASSHLQINDIFSALGAPSVEHAFLEVELLNHARLLTYASVVDNQSHDPVFVPGISPFDGARTLLVPAAAAGSGAAGTHWRTDLRVMAVEAGETPEVEVTFYPSDASSWFFPRATFSAAEGSLGLAVDDVVTAVGGTGSGALRLQAVSGDIVATSRTYNVTDRGTLGQLIPAETTSWQSNLKNIIGVTRSEDFRSNIGLFNPTSGPVEALVKLIAEDGNILGSRLIALGPYHHHQINDIFTRFSVPWQERARVEVEDLTGTWQLRSYLSVVDNHSGDAVYLPGQRLYRRSEAPIVLDNMVNAVLLDELPEAVGVDELPAGDLTANLSGSGDLGSAALPIQVLCLYKDQELALRSAVLEIGDSLAGIAGGEGLWCVIPDWIDRDDNQGLVTLTVEGGQEPLSLSLDARANAVLFDRLEASVTVARPPAEAYRIEVTGDLGRPELATQVVVMNRQAGERRLWVRALEHGGEVQRVATDFQLLAVVVDWISRADNSGTASLVPVCTVRRGECGVPVVGHVSDTDCPAPDFPGSFNQEEVELEAVAGQVVDVRLTSDYPFSMGLEISTSNNQLVLLERSEGDLPLVIRNLVLPADDTYTFAVAMPSSWEVNYQLEITCH